MARHFNKEDRKTIRNVESFQKLQEALKKGFAGQDQELTNTDLLDVSDSLAKALYDGTGYRQRADTVNQFRKFFNEVNGLKTLTGNPEKLSVELRMLKARMGYAAGRETISKDFSIVITACIDRMIELKDFKTHISGFCNFFESLYAYYYFHVKAR